MPATTTCQLLIDPPASGAWNMAVDEALLEAVADSGQPALRFYQWQRPTLSLGYFQSYAERSAHPASQATDVVRRQSGGGAIVHDQEVTYSLILPASHTLARDTQSLYNKVHQIILETLNTFLDSFQSCWQPVLCEQTLGLTAREEPFLCFQRRSIGDILLHKKLPTTSTTTHKIVGSAQRRRQRTVLQHGSILLGQSSAAPQLPGIYELTAIKILPADLLVQLSHRLGQTLQLALTESSLSEALIAKAEQLQQQKYEATTWTERR